MQISSRFTIAVHMLTCMDIFQNKYKITGDFLAGSVNVNPVVIRRLLVQLKAAGLIDVVRGSGGASISRPLAEISLLDVYRAVESVDSEGLFRFHENPNPNCSVGRNIQGVLSARLDEIQTAMENEMRKTSLADIVADTKEQISREA